MAQNVTIVSPDKYITVTPALDTNAYASGDLLFDSVEIANAVRSAGGTAIIQTIVIQDKDDNATAAAMTLGFSNAATDYGTLNSAPDPDDTEGETSLGTVAVAVSDWVDYGAYKLATLRNVGLFFGAAASSTSIWMHAISNGAPTFTASGLKIKIGLLRS